AGHGPASLRRRARARLSADHRHHSRGVDRGGDRQSPHRRRLRDRRSAHPLRLIMRLTRSRAAMMGLTVVAVVILAGLVGPALTGSPSTMGARTFCPPSPECLFGTDDLGRDMLARVANGARVSLLVGVAAAAVSAILGVLVGALAGFAGGKID